MPKSVCVIGAGPSGLVAAKTFLHAKAPFKVTVYDGHPRLGGLWPSRRDEFSRMIHPLMVANVSRHTMQFSDFAWGEGEAECPRAWRVGLYLEGYAGRYLGDAEILYERTVVSAVREEGSWCVEVEGRAGGREKRRFDHLVVATGFFGKKRMPDGVRGTKEVPVVHSTEYSDLKSLVGGGRGGGKILVVGGQLSGVEVAATIATNLSSAVNSPGPSPIPNPEKYTVHHLSERPTWVLPLLTSPKSDEKAPRFLPLDLNTANLAMRPHPLTNILGGHITEELAKHSHAHLQGTLGTTQEEYSPFAKIQDTSAPPFISISQNYLEFIRAGLITLSRGRITGFEGCTATTTSDPIEDVAAVVLATGFDPSPSLDFLSEDVLETLQHSPKHPDITPLLAFHATHHPSIPELGFVGFYRSPYWGVAEMQARFLAALWSDPRPKSIDVALGEDKSMEGLAALRDDPRTAQFPMGDYPFLMQEFSRALGMTMSKPLEPPLIVPQKDTAMDILTPARYSLEDAPPEAQAETRKSLEQTHSKALASLSGTRYVAPTVFRSLLGAWKLERDITSKLPSHPSGHFSGTAKFLLRSQTPDGLQCASDPTSQPSAKVAEDDEGLEYLYIEEGTFKATNGFSFPATRRYVYRYDGPSDTLSVWFVKPDDDLRADYLFHNVEFDARSGEDGGGWRATAGHLCIDDFYGVEYEFVFKGVNIARWEVGYKVRGPKKDYILKGTYTR